MICLQENVCFLHDIQLQGLCVSPPVYIRVCVWERGSVCMPSHLCFTDCVWKGHRPLSITQNLLTSFLAVCLSPQSNPLTPLLIFSGKWSSPNLNRCCPLFTGVATQHKWISLCYLQNRPTHIQYCSLTPSSVKGRIGWWREVGAVQLVILNIAVIE